MTYSQGIVFEETLIISVDDEDTVEMIDLVLDGDGKEAAGREGLVSSVFVIIFDGDRFVSFDREEFSGEGEASFFEENAVADMILDGRVDEDELFFIYLDYR